MTAPPLKAVISALPWPEVRADSAVRTLAAVAAFMPIKPQVIEQIAPPRKAKAVCMFIPKPISRKTRTMKDRQHHILAPQKGHSAVMDRFGNFLHRRVADRLLLDEDIDENGDDETDYAQWWSKHLQIHVTTSLSLRNMRLLNSFIACGTPCMSRQVTALAEFSTTSSSCRRSSAENELRT